MLMKEEQMENDDWFDLSDEEVTTFKKKINLWLKNVDEDQRLSARSERHHSKGSSKKSVKFNKSIIMQIKWFRNKDTRGKGKTR